MTEEQVVVAQQYVHSFMKQLNYPQTNLHFIKGYIEFLTEAGVKSNSLDLVISNCVVNLSPNKPQVLSSVHSVLKQGGEFYFSDVYCDRRLPEHVRNHEVLYGECIAGALYMNDFVHMCKTTGFKDPRILSKEEIIIHDPELKEIVGEARFFSITYRLFKLDNLEPQCEDYGQYAIYKGNMEGYANSYLLDDHHKFETKRPVLVCGNTASMLSETWLSPYFEVVGDRSVHYGQFDCSAPVVVNEAKKESVSSCCA